MNTRFSFAVDESLKKKALAKAKREGITMDALFDYVMSGFVDGKISFELRGANEK